jgi:hypothetical protein
MTRDELAKKFAEDAKRIGVPRNDVAKMRKLFEAIAANDSRLPVSQQEGFARMFREYGPKGYTQFFNIVDKHWPAYELAAPEPPAPPAPERRIEHLDQMSWLIEFENVVDPLAVGSLINANLQDSADGSTVQRIGTRTPSQRIELLISHCCSLDKIERAMRKLAGVNVVLCRDPLDFGQDVVPGLGDNYTKEAA